LILSEFIINNDYEVLTNNGFKNFSGIKKSINDKKIKFILINGKSITVTNNHKFYIFGNFIKAKDLREGDCLEYKGDNLIIKEIINNPSCTNKFYDLVEVEDGNHYTVSGVEVSNCAFIRSSLWDEFADSVFPAQDALANKQTILSSTPNGLNHYYHLVEGALKNMNGYKVVECTWDEVPRWNKDGSLKDPEVFKAEQIAKNGLIFWNQNFGAEFLGSSHTLVSGTVLKNINCMKDDEIIHNSLFEGLRIFEEPKQGHHYIVTSDPKKDGLDAVGVQVVDVTNLPFKQVAAANIMASYLVVPGRLFDLGNYYNKALVVCENNVGESIPSTLFYNYEYEGEVFVEKNKNGKPKNEMGIRTTTKTKRLGLTLLKKFIEEGNLIINDRKTLDELFNFIEKKKGTYAAEEGYHDDLVMSLMLAFAPFLDFKNFDDFRGFVEYLEKRKDEQEKEEQEAAEFLDLGFSSEEDEEETMGFTLGIWDE
jgi:hypothetical protein